METAIVLLRGVNVAGRRVPTKDLRSSFDALGYRNIRTYIQSGNVVFEHGGLRAERIVEQMERKLTDDFGFEIKVIVRSGHQLSSVVSSFPFARKGADWSYVTFLARQSSKLTAEIIDAKRSKHEEFHIAGREVYLSCPDGYGRSGLSNSFIERTAGVPATTRNWRTVLALDQIAKA